MCHSSDGGMDVTQEASVIVDRTKQAECRAWGQKGRDHHSENVSYRPGRSTRLRKRMRVGGRT